MLIDSKYSTVICALVYTTFDGLSTQVSVGVDEGLKHNSSIHCDTLVGIPKSSLTHFVGTLSLAKIQELNQALIRALSLER